MAVKWEHRHDSRSEGAVQALLAQRGDEGWELVSTHSYDGGAKFGYPIIFHLFFKRPAKEPA